MAGRVALLNRFSGVGTANGIGTCSTVVGRKLMLLYATVKYSAAPTQAGITLVLDSGLGATYDITITTGAANTQNNIYLPTQASIIIFPDDVLTLTAPAGGGVITNTCVIVCEVIS